MIGKEACAHSQHFVFDFRQKSSFSVCPQGYITSSENGRFCSVSILDHPEFSPEPLQKIGTGCIPTSCILEKVSEYQSRLKSAFYRRKSTSRWFYRLRKMRRSLKATYLSQFKALLKSKTLCGRAYRTGVGGKSHMKSCAAGVDNVPRLDCKRRHKQHILYIGALNVRKYANSRDVEARKRMSAASVSSND
jgi:hypothetical protein